MTIRCVSETAKKRAGMGKVQPDLLDDRHELPVFDVPNYTLFPHTVVPFHVYDKRYSDVLDAVLSDRRLLVVTGLRPGWEDRGAEAPVYEVAGLARILSDRRFHDGRYNIFVHCIARVQIVSMHSQNPFRLVDVERLDDEADDILQLDRTHSRVLSLAQNLIRELGDDGAPLSKVVTSTNDPAVLSHRLAGMLVESPEERQAFLENRSALSRCEQIEGHLVKYLMDQSERPNWIN